MILQLDSLVVTEIEGETSASEKSSSLRRTSIARTCRLAVMV
jgi:hypothetical protein